MNIAPIDETFLETDFKINNPSFLSLFNGNPEDKNSVIWST